MTETMPHDALVMIMVTMSAADTSMTDAELTQIGRIIHNQPIFRDYDDERLMIITDKCRAMLEDDDGIDSILDIAKKALPVRLYETAYALAVEVAAADLQVGQEELRYLQMVRDTLDLDKLTVAAIEKSAQVRYRII